MRCEHTLQVTFRSHEIQPHAIREAIAELGYGAAVNGVHPVSKERRVARIQVMLTTINFSLLVRCAGCVVM